MKFAGKHVTVKQLSQRSGIKSHRIRRLFHADHNVHLYMQELRKIAEAFSFYGIHVTAEELKGNWRKSPNHYLRWFACRKMLKKSFREMAAIMKQVQWLASQSTAATRKTSVGIVLKI